jgi:hypothetical protein
VNLFPGQQQLNYFLDFDILLQGQNLSHRSCSALAELTVSSGVMYAIAEAGIKV